jgi:hypothetical protein
MIVACGLLVAACHTKAPAICNIGPPDDPKQYDKWADDVTNAHCPGMHPDQNAVLANNAVS